ncbi:hypothetical protein ACWDSJ_14315 [Nocardia sp. NPDC003482]
MSFPVPDHTFVRADSVLAEVLCHAHLMDLTHERAEELRFVHQDHHPDECVVHLEAACLLLTQDEDGH